MDRPIGFGEDQGKDKNIVAEAEEISNVLSGLWGISLGTLHLSFVVIDCESLLLVGDINSEVVAVDYVWRHLGVVDVDVVDVGTVYVGVVDTGDADVSDAVVGDVDVGVSLDGVSRFGSFLGLLITQSSVVTALVPSQVPSIDSLIY